MLPSRDGEPRECPGEPNNFLVARLMARLRALEAARDAMLDGEDDRGGGALFGGGGKVVGIAYSGVYSSIVGVEGILRS